MENKGERLQKVLARAGIASRRHAEELITGGRVRVNGRVVTELGVRVVPHQDKVEVDGRRIVAEPLIYYILHKPRGVVTTLQDPEGRPTIAEYVKDLPARVFPVGRLDFHTSGAILLTNDGALAQALLHPRHKVAKTYVCKVKGVPTDLQLEPWREGMMLPPTESDPEEARVKTVPAEIDVLRHAPGGEDATTDTGSTWMKVTLYEGRSRQIHRMAEATGLFVMRLARLSFAGINTEGLRPGKLRPLTDKELTALRVRFLRPIEMGALKPGGEVEEEPLTAESPAGRTGRKPASQSGGWTAPASRDVPVATEVSKRRPGGAAGRLRTPRPATAATDTAGPMPRKPPREGDAPRSRTAAPTERRPPAREGRAPVRNDRTPVRNDRAPAREGRAPAREGRAPARDDRAPAREGRAPVRDDGRGRKEPDRGAPSRGPARGPATPAPRGNRPANKPEGGTRRPTEPSRGRTRR